MSFPNPLYDPSRRRGPGPRRYHRDSLSSHHSPFTSLATTAAIAYGAYRLGSLAWNAYFGEEVDDHHGDHENNEKENNGGQGDILYEWSEDYRAVERDIRREEGFNDLSEEETTDGEGDFSTPNKSSGRSRRSRGDWGAINHERRSHRASPPQDHRRGHYSRTAKEENHAKGDDDNDDGMVKQGMMKKAAAAASSGIGAAVSVGISAGIHAYNQNSIAASQSQSSDSIIPDQERRLRTGRCRLETSRAVMDFLPTLKKAVVKETDVSVETGELKILRKRKKEILEMKVQVQNQEDDLVVSGEENVEEDAIREKERCLWNNVKNKSIARLVTTIYAHTIVFLVLTVQVNLLGGRLLREELEEKESTMEQKQDADNALSGADRYRTSHQNVLAKTYHHLFAEGIPSLAGSVEQAVTEILQTWDVLGDSASLRDVSTWMECVRDKIEQRKEKTGGLNSLLKFIIPPEGEEAAAGHDETKNSTDAAEDELAKYILDETYDLLESPTYANAQRRCLDATFDQLRTKVIGELFLREDRLPLANVVTHLQKSAVATFHKPPSYREEMKSWEGVLGMMEEPLPSVPNVYISKLERLEDVLELADVCF